MAPGNNVNITISVTDANASAEVQQVVTQLNALGPAGEAGGAAAAAGLDQVGEHALTSLDNVRLLRDDLGIHIPRSMEKAIASSQMLSGAIGAMGSGLLALGAVELFAHLGESIYNAYEKYIDINAAQKEFFDTYQKNKDADFINVHSIETATQRLGQATSAVTSYQDAAKAAQATAFMDVATYGVNAIPSALGNLYLAGQLSHGSAKAMGQTQELSPQEQALLHQQNMAQIDADHAGDSGLKGQQKITAELEKQLAIDKEKQRYTAIEDREKGNPGGANSGAALQGIEDQSAQAKAAAERLQLQRQENDQIIQMQNEATNAGLEGNALRATQEQQAIDAITRKFREGEIDKQTMLAETAAQHAKYNAQEMKLQEALDEQTKKMADDTAQAGLKGVPLIEAQLRSQLDAIDAAEKKAVGTGNETGGQSIDYNSQRVSAAQASYQKIGESNEQFQERIRALTDATNDFELQGYARIEGEAQKHLDALSRDYEQQYGSDQSKWSGYQAALTQIEANADREREQLHRKTMDQIDKEEEQAARLLLPEWQQSMVAIEDEYQQRLRQIQQDVKTHVMTEQEGAAAVTAAWALESAQLEKNAEQTRDKLASTLQDLFKNPEQFFEKRAMDAAFQMMANDALAVMQKTAGTTGGGMLQWLFGMGPQMSTSTNPMTDIKSLFGGGGHGGSSTMILNQAGSTLVSAGTGLNTAAMSLQQAASALGMAGGGGGIGGGLAGISGGGSSSGWSSSAAGISPDAASGQVFSGSSAPDINALASTPGSFDNSVGDFTSSEVAVGSSLGGGMGSKVMGAAGGAFTAGMGIYSAYENSNPIAGAVSGAMGGAAVGAAFGGPVGGLIGAAIGGVAGLLAGIFGDQGKGKAQSYDTNTVQPTIVSELQSYNLGQSGYNSVANDLYNLQTSAKNQTNQLGSGARSWYTNHILPEIDAALNQLGTEEAGGRGQISLSAAQYHTGGWVNNFGDFGTSGNEGFIHAMQGEFMVNPTAASAHAPLLQAMNSGTNFGYSKNVQPRMPAGGSGSNVQLTIQALDSKSVSQWAKAGGGRTLVAAINQAQRQYAGVGRG